MNPTTLKIAVNTARQAYEAFSDYKDRKAAEAYDLLAAAAEKTPELREKSVSLLDESKAEAGKVAQSARLRLEVARKEAEKRQAAYLKDAAKGRKKLSKKAQKARAQALKNAEKRAVKLGLVEDKKKSRGGAIALLAAIAGAIYWFFMRPEKPSTVPPRVEEQTAGSSKLVYSTTTPMDEEADDLLESLDKQLAEHRAEAGESVEGAAESEVDAEAADEVMPINDGEFAAEHIDEAVDEADVAALDDLEAQADEAQADFDKKFGK